MDSSSVVTSKKQEGLLGFHGQSLQKCSVPARGKDKALYSYQSLWMEHAVVPALMEHRLCGPLRTCQPPSLKYRGSWSELRQPQMMQLHLHVIQLSLHSSHYSGTKHWFSFFHFFLLFSRLRIISAHMFKIRNSFQINLFVCSFINSVSP